MISDEQWRIDALNIPAKLKEVFSGEDDRDLKEAMLVVWTALATASSTIKHLYSLVREAEILAIAANFDLATPSYGLTFDGTESYEEVVKRLGGCLRAMERELTDWDLGSRPSDPNKWLVSHGDNSAFLIPMGRLAWREPKDPDQDRRPFDQRGLLRLRFIPSIVDGAKVRIVKVDRLAKSEVRGFGAVLFPHPTFDCEEGDAKFVVKAVHIPDGNKIIIDACKHAHTDSCLASVFPELMIDPEARQLIRSQLAEKPWLTDGDLPEAPGFVVAGSWHEMEGPDRYNVATVYDGHGDELLRHKKRLAYTGPDGLTEDIKHGTEFAILVLDNALFAFGICLDFCNQCYLTPYGGLDVDFVIVPSCGDDKTMISHIRTARDLHDSRKTRSFVVQEAYPPIAGVAGFVLNPDGKPAEWAANGLLVAVPWSVFHC